MQAVNYHEILDQARAWGMEHHTQASRQHIRAFANAVAYLVTGLSGGYGGPSVREHAVSWESLKLRDAGQWEFNAACQLAWPLVFGPITALHKEVYAREHCHDDDPDDLKALKEPFPNEKYPSVHFRLSEGSLKRYILARVEEGQPASRVVARDLERYYSCLRQELPQFSYREALYLSECFNGHSFSAHSVHLLWAEVADAWAESPHDEIDGPALIERLRRMNRGQCLALADAIERVWLGAYDVVDDMGERIRAVGLVK